MFPLFRHHALRLFIWLLYGVGALAAEELMLSGRPGEDVLLARERQVLPEVAAVVHAMEEEEAWRTTQLVRRAAREVDSLLRVASPPRRQLHFMVMESAFEGAQFAADEVPLKKRESDEARLMRILTGLLRRRAAELVEATAHQQRNFASGEFIAAALCNRIFYDGKGGSGSYMPDYRVARRQFNAGHFPRCRWLLERPVSTEEPLCFRIYAVHCDVLLKCLEEAGGRNGIFKRLWEAEMRQKQPLTAALCHAVGIEPPGDGALQGWYERNALSAVRRGVRSVSSDDTLRLLREILSVPVLATDTPGGIKYIPLAELADRLSDYRLDQRALMVMQYRLAQFQQGAPPLLRGALGEYRAAVALLMEGEERAFRRRCRAAGNAFRTAWERQERTGALLDDVVARDTGENALLRNYLWRTILERLEGEREKIGRISGLHEE